MMQKQEERRNSKFFTILMLVPTIFSLIGNLFRMMRAEIDLMRKHLIIISILFLFLLVLMLSTWLCVNALIYIYLVSLTHNISVALALLLAFNFLLIVITCLWISLMKIDATFPETRKAINDIVSRN